MNRRDATLGIHDSNTLAQRASVPVVTEPEQVAVMADGSLAFVLSRTQPRLSVVDLRRGVLLANLQLAGKPTEMLLKPDGGELYVISPESHGLQVINTWTHEVGDHVLLGSAPTRGVLYPDASEMFVTDTAADRVTPVDINNRRVERPISAGQDPEELRFDSNDPAVKPNLLLVVNRGSGDLSVIGLRAGSASLVTMIPVGPQPRDLAIKLF
jgi:YVTN family beta-propeller protein